MPRPKVPHCKSCNYSRDLNQCNFYYKQKYWICKLNNKYINGQEIRTSPKWCPLRNKQE